MSTNGHKSDKPEIPKKMKKGVQLEHALNEYGDIDLYVVRKVNRKTGEIVVEWCGGYPGM